MARLPMRKDLDRMAAATAASRLRSRQGSGGRRGLLARVRETLARREHRGGA